MKRTIAIIVGIMVAFHLFYSTFFYTSTGLCYCFSSAENKEGSNTTPCCSCCNTKIPLPNETSFLRFFEKDSYPNNICYLQRYISDNYIPEELYNITYEGRLTPTNVIYSIFKPPKV